MSQRFPQFAIGCLLLATNLVASSATADGPAPATPQVIVPDALRWYAPFGNDSVQVAWVLGTEAAPGPYLLRVQLAPGARIPAHRHPDGRSTTVLRGTLYVGFGDQVDDSRLVAVPEGGIYVAPVGVAHFLWARDGEVVYQEAGVGPTGNLPAAR